MVETALFAGRCTLAPQGFGSWPSLVSEGFDAGVGFDWGWTSIRPLGKQIDKGKLLLRYDFGI